MRPILFLLAFFVSAGCNQAPLEPTTDAGADLERGDLEQCRTDRFNWIQNDGGPACCGVEGGRCCASANPCDPGLRCVLNYTSTCVKDFLDGGTP